MFEFDLAEQDDKALLRLFLQQLERFLINWLVERRIAGVAMADTPLFFVPEAEQRLFEAFEEFRGQRHIDRVIAAVEAMDQDALSVHGLTGAQLRVKLFAITQSQARFITIPGFRVLRRFIEAIDILLKSILDAAGVGGAIEEIKDIFFNLTETE